MKNMWIAVLVLLVGFTSCVWAQAEPDTYDSYAEALSALQRGVFYTPQDLSNVGEKPVNGKDRFVESLEFDAIALINSKNGKKFVPLQKKTPVRYEVFYEGQAPKPYALDECGNKIWYLAKVTRNGFDGERGPRGFDGIQGIPGERGEKGNKGDKGDPGRDEKSHTGLIIGTVAAVAIVATVAIIAMNNNHRSGGNTIINNNNPPPPVIPIVPLVVPPVQPPSGDSGSGS
jgi:hypothetical protein